MTNENMKYWDQFADIDPDFTKPITGKPYKGTSPNPQYVIRCLTEMFGPVGHGFGWRVLEEGFQPMGDEVLHWCRIWFWTRGDDSGFESYGQTKLIMKTRSGFMNDEDAPKKSMTDAIIKAASYVGVASNIFLGRWDDQKYVAQVSAEYAEKNNPVTQAEIDTAIETINACNTLKDLKSNFTALYQNARNVADNQSVIDAKNYRKSELEKS